MGALLLAAALLSLLVCGSARADAPMRKFQAPGFYRMMVGEFEVTALLDENSPWPENVDTLFPQLSSFQKRDLLEKTHLQKNYDFSTIAFLVNTGHKLILIDTGGNGSGASYGQMFPNLRAAGYSPEQIDEIYITHMHPDHIGGLIDAGKMAFPNATVFADVHELPEWEEAAKRSNANAQAIVKKIETYRQVGRFKTFDGSTDFFVGFRSVESYGHSAGHSFYVLESKGQKMVFWGDFVVNDKVQLEFPDVQPPGEKDSIKGVSMRKKEFADAAREGYVVAGAHFAFPGFGRVRDLGDRYIWVPVDYASTVK